MKLWSAHLFRHHAELRGLSDPEIRSAWQFTNALQRAGLPPVLTLRHLASKTGVWYEVLREVVSRHGIRAHYRSFRSSKRSGGIRRIYVPTLDLSRAQRWIHDEILTKQSVHDRAFAFREGRPVTDCAEAHCGARWLVKFDAKNFFESFDEQDVHRVFRSMGYPPLLCFEMSRLLTVPTDYLTKKAARDKAETAQDIIERSGGVAAPDVVKFEDSESDGDGDVGLDVSTDSKYSIRAYDFHERGILGQGISTSPVLSNILCRGLDESLQTLADKEGLVYTRYADDITFSTSRKRLSKKTIQALRRSVCGHLGRYGLRENKRKFSVVGPGARRTVLGLLVDGPHPRLSRASRSRVEGHLYYLAQRGPAAHAITRGFRSIDALREHVLGLLAYVKQVDGERYRRYRELFDEIKWPPP